MHFRPSSWRSIKHAQFRLHSRPAVPRPLFGRCLPGPEHWHEDRVQRHRRHRPLLDRRRRRLCPNLLRILREGREIGLISANPLIATLLTRKTCEGCRKFVYCIARFGTFGNIVTCVATANENL